MHFAESLGRICRYRYQSLNQSYTCTTALIALMVLNTGGGHCWETWPHSLAHPGYRASQGCLRAFTMESSYLVRGLMGNSITANLPESMKQFFHPGKRVEH